MVDYLGCSVLWTSEYIVVCFGRVCIEVLSYQSYELMSEFIVSKEQYCEV